MHGIPIRHLDATQKEPDLSENFSIRDMDSLLAGKDMVQELHRHDFFYVLAIKKGAGHHDIDFISYKAFNHAVFFMRPGQVHQLTLKAGSTGYLLQFRAEFHFPPDKVTNHLLRKASRINHYQFDTKGFEKLFEILTCIFQEYAGRQESYKEAVKANMDIFFIELARQQNNNPFDQANIYMQEQLEKFLALLETNIFSHKQVAQYAEMLNLSIYQLNAIVKATLGKTCSELIIEHLILEAKRCLLVTANQINQIAYYLGYEDVSYFIRFFKKHTGLSPEAFRLNFG